MLFSILFNNCEKELKMLHNLELEKIHMIQDENAHKS